MMTTAAKGTRVVADAGEVVAVDMIPHAPVMAMEAPLTVTAPFWAKRAPLTVVKATKEVIRAYLSIIKKKTYSRQ